VCGLSDRTCQIRFKFSHAGAETGSVPYRWEKPVPVPKRLVVDTDPGVDDALALALALVSPEVDVELVTTVAGNSPLDVTMPNALRLLRLLGREEVPVAAGADRALVRVPWHGQDSPHGVDGLGGVELAESGTAVRTGHAVDQLAALLSGAEPGSVTIAAIGPLTNVALLLALRPDLADRIERLVVMGGSQGRGNITPVAEFNIWTDPEAAQRVLADSGVPITLVGLDVTRRATVDDTDLATLRGRSAEGGLLADMVLGYGDRAPGGWPLHDVLAVATVIDPTLLRTRRATVEVDTTPGPGRGQTVTSFEDVGTHAKTPVGGPVIRTWVDVAVDVDADRFRDLLVGRVGHPQPA
jgi:pyrimidine-specific ribonucleoside hydrolase